MARTPKWGLVSTIKAPPRDILAFAAYHLDAGAHRLYIYLDMPSPAYDFLKAHSKIRPVICNDAYWHNRLKLKKRPAKHQARQSANATHAYQRAQDIEWLGHIDVDEFLLPPEAISEALANTDPDARCLRMRPMELLAGSHDQFKVFVPTDGRRDEVVAQLYPTFGTYLKGGFLSHVAGKIFVRTGLEGISWRIHNVFGASGAQIETDAILTDINLAHLHAKTWEQWREIYDYRLEHGSYRAELAGHLPGMRVNAKYALFHDIAAQHGEAGLRDFFTEVAQDSPDLRARLDKQGLLRQYNLDLEAKLARHFPDF